MASKVFLDANFLLDLSLQRAGFADAKSVMQLSIAGEIELVTTPAVLHITGYFITKAYNRQVSKQLLLALLNDVQVIDCNHSTALMAIHSSIADIEDALQYYTALTHKADYFISSDAELKKAALPQLPVYTAAAFVAAWEKGGL
ncbi:MAG: PIN domain-containing protein [Agriterribacter sp.]